jgi:hypothetical protein
MARSRNIKPQFFINEHLATKSPYARLLFIGLWCLADCKGRLEDRPLRIKAVLFPYEDIDVDTLLDELCHGSERFIIRYQVNGDRYIEIPNFSKHQNPHKREKETGSYIPPCSVQVWDQSGTGTVQASDLHSTSPADSLLLNPDSLTPENGMDDVSESGLEKEEIDPRIKATAQKGADYLLSLNSPNHKNIAWVRGFLTIQLEELAVNRPELTHDQILVCWQDACDLGVSKNVSAPQWLKTTFKNKLNAFIPEPRMNPPTGQSVEEAQALLTFPFVRHLMTDEIFDSKDLSISEDSPNGLTHKRGAYYPFRQLEGLTEVPTNA